MRSTFCGTLDYLCPELIDGQKYYFGPDIWSLGVFLYEGCSGKAPFNDKEQKATLSKIKNVFIKSKD